jgi:ribonuclease R
MKFAEYMSKHIGETFQGRVTSIANFGCYVQLDNTVEGFVSMKTLGDDFYSYDEKSNELKGKNTGARIYFGMKVNVECIAANKNTSKIEFKILSKL